MKTEFLQYNEKLYHTCQCIFLGGGGGLLCFTIKRNLRNKNIYMFLSASIHYIYIVHVYGIGGHHGCDRMVVGFTTTCGMQSVPITTKVVSSNPVHCEVYSIQHCLIEFVSDLQQVFDILQVLRFPPSIKLISMI